MMLRTKSGQHGLVFNYGFDNKGRRITRAMLFVIPADKAEKPFVIAHETVTCSKKDVYVKKVGRELALDRLCVRLEMLLNNRVLSGQVRAAYFNRHKLRKEPRYVNKLTAIAADILNECADVLALNSTHEWDFPDSWTEDDKRVFCEAYHVWNGDPENYNPDRLVLPDFAVANFMANLIRNGWLSFATLKEEERMRKEHQKHVQV